MKRFSEYKGFWKPQRRVSKVFIHCSASPYKKHATPQVIHQWHKERGWAEIGYHIFVDFEGKAFYGRSLEKIPAAQRGNNTGSIAICFAGLNPGDFTTAQFNFLRSFSLEVDRAYGGEVTFHGHCEVANKSCPVFDYKRELNLDQKGYLKVGTPTVKKLRVAGSTTIAKADSTTDVSLALGVAGTSAGVTDAMAPAADAVKTVQTVNGVVSDYQSAITNGTNLMTWLISHWYIALIIVCIYLLYSQYKIKQARVKDEEKIGRLQDAPIV